MPVEGLQDAGQLIVATGSRVFRLASSVGRLSISVCIWRDCVGIEPTEPGTQAPQGFEDPGGHQSPIQPHVVVADLYKFILKKRSVQDRCLNMHRDVRLRLETAFSED